MPVTVRGGDILFNDGTTQSTASNLPANTTNVLNATAGASVGAVGTYALLFCATGGVVNPGTTQAASNLYFAHANGGYAATRPSGTWRCMGYVSASDPSIFGTTVFLRIS